MFQERTLRFTVVIKRYFGLFIPIFISSLLLTTGIEGLRLTIGNPSITPSNNQIQQEGNVFLFHDAQLPNANGSVLLISIRGHFLNSNPTALHVWRQVPGEVEWYLRLEKEYLFSSTAGSGTDTIDLYKETSPTCVLVQPGDILGVFFRQVPGALSYVTSGQFSVLRHHITDPSQYPTEGSELEFDTLSFPFSFALQATFEVGEVQDDASYSGATCTDFEDIVQAYEDMTTAAPSSSTPINLKGESGATGATGPIGVPGLNGIPGTKGDRGDIGPPGIQGFTGPIGPTGAPGIGEKGDRGEPGVKGDRGDMGPPGTWAPGEGGEPGEKGERGDSGPPGPQGDAGALGPQGEKGDLGDRGPRGNEGATGATGAQGDRGNRGRDGATGPRGPPGPANNETLPRYAGSSSSDNDDSKLLQDYVIIIIIVWNVVITLLVIALFTRKLCTQCRKGRNKIGHSDPDFTDPYQADNDATLVRTSKPKSKASSRKAYGRNHSEA